jgi:hypothetical protein
MKPYRITIHQYGSTIVLPCGLIVESTPHDTDAYRATAEALGYGQGPEATLRCAQDHDALHALLMAFLGIESFSLRQAAGQDVDASLAADEESAVLAVQKFAVRAAVDIRGLVKCEG